METRGIELAAQYIAKQFRDLGLITNLCDGTPFQEFQATARSELGADNRLALTGPASGGTGKLATHELTLGEDFTPLAIGGSNCLDLPLVFAGYGVTDKAAGYDDYAELNVAGKAVVVLRGYPWRARYPRNATAVSSLHGEPRHKIANAFAHAAAALILCANQEDVEWGTYRGDALPKFSVLGFRCRHRDLPVVFTRRSIWQPAIRATYGMDLFALEDKIERDLTPRSRELKGWRIAGQVDVRRVTVEVKNVVAVLPGSGRIAEETVAVGAHYDHFGVKETKVGGKRERSIYSGADDNASGVAGMLEIARYLAHHRHSLDRRVVFVAFAAEEEGLVGSSYYVEHPVVPLSRTVVMLNLDMIGRLRDNTLHVRGSFTATGWGGLLERLNQRHGLALDLPPDNFGSSDQLAFYAKRVPILHFFTGRHEDYHQPTDKFEKLNIAGMRRVTQFAEDIAETLADAPMRPQYLAAVRPDQQEACFGVFGDFTRTEPGFAVGPVALGGPADRAGLSNGDVVVRLGQDRIGNVDDFDEALTHHVIGERVPVLVRRGKESRSINVTLSSPNGWTSPPLMSVSSGQR